MEANLVPVERLCRWAAQRGGSAHTGARTLLAPRDSKLCTQGSVLPCLVLPCRAAAVTATVGSVTWLRLGELISISEK